MYSNISESNDGVNVPTDDVKLFNVASFESSYSKYTTYSFIADLSALITVIGYSVVVDKSIISGISYVAFGSSNTTVKLSFVRFEILFFITN